MRLLFILILLISVQAFAADLPFFMDPVQHEHEQQQYEKSRQQAVEEQAARDRKEMIENQREIIRQQQEESTRRENQRIWDWNNNGR